MQAIDAKDLISLTSSISVTYNIPQSSDKIAYQDLSLNSPWIDVSWGLATPNIYNSAEQIYAGSSSFKTVLNAWGAVRLRHGNWGAGINIDPSLYSSFQFIVHGGTTGGQIRVLLENDASGVFTAYTTTIPASQWTVINVPMGQLNPNNNVIHSFYIQNSASSQKTFYLEDIKFVS